MKTLKLKTINVTVAIAGVPVKISDSPIYTNDFNFQPKISNTGTYMYLGEESTLNTKISYSTGSISNFTAGTADPVKDYFFDLSKWFLDSDTNGDIGIFQYRAYEE